MSEKILLSEAATRLGKSPTTLRKLVNTGIISTTKDKQGRHWVDFSVVHTHYAQRSAPQDKRSAPEKIVENEQSLLKEKVALLERVLEREERINDELRGQVKQLEGELLKITHELKTLLSGKTGNTLSRWIQTIKNA